MWPAIGHLWFKLPKYVSVVNKYTLRAKGVEAADICFTFCTCVAVSNRPVLWNKTLQPLIPLRWFCYFLYLHYSCACSIKLLMLIWHTASIKIYKVQHNSAILKANQLKKPSKCTYVCNFFDLKCKFNNTIDDQYSPIFPRLKIKKKKATYIALFCTGETYELNSCHQILVT